MDTDCELGVYPCECETCLETRRKAYRKKQRESKMKESKTLKELDSMIENFGSSNPTYWGCAIAGEVGEVANLLKKLERDGVWKATRSDISTVSDVDAMWVFGDLLGDELADTFIYTILIAREYGIDLERAILKKLEKVQQRLKEGTILKD